MIKTILQIAGVVALLAFSVAVLLIARQVQLTAWQVQGMLHEIRPELKETLRQAKITAFESRTDFKAFMQDFNSIENMRGRRATMRFGESGAALVEQLRAETLPRLDANLDRIGEAIVASNTLIRNTDTSLNAQLLPEATKLLASLRGTSDAFGTDARAVLAELTAMAKQGTVTLEGASRVVASTQWEGILRNVERGTFHISEFTSTLNPIALEILARLKTAAPWQKPLLLAQLIATLVHIIP